MVEYFIAMEAFEIPLGLTVPFSVAVVPVTLVAALVVTVGGDATSRVMVVVALPAEFWAYIV